MISSLFKTLHSRSAAPWIALLLSGGLLGGAWIFQYGFGYFPCTMCYWQRHAHKVVLGIAVLWLILRTLGVEAAEILRRANCTSLYTVSNFLGQDYAANLDGFDLPNLTQIIKMKDGDDSAPFHAYLARGGDPVTEPCITGNDIADINNDGLDKQTREAYRKENLRPNGLPYED